MLFPCILCSSRLSVCIVRTSPHIPLPALAEKYNENGV
jgi:hypothetical protein